MTCQHPRRTFTFWDPPPMNGMMGGRAVYLITKGTTLPGAAIRGEDCHSEMLCRVWNAVKVKGHVALRMTLLHTQSEKASEACRLALKSVKHARDSLLCSGSGECLPAWLTKEVTCRPASATHVDAFLNLLLGDICATRRISGTPVYPCLSPANRMCVPAGVS